MNRDDYPIVGSFYSDFQQHRMSALIHIREKLLNRKHNVIVFNALHTLFTLASYLSIPRIYGESFRCIFFYYNHQSLARIIDLQICTWLKQDPIESDRITTWIETHQDVFQFDRRIKYIKKTLDN